MNQEAQPKKKGFSPLAWIAIGCVGLILVGAAVVAVGGFFAAKKVKEVVDEIQESGELSVTTDEGETTISLGEGGPTVTTEGADGQRTNFSVFGDSGDTSNVPPQIQYPEAESASAVMASKSGGRWSGMFNYTTRSSMDEVVDWQGEQLDDCKITRSDFAGLRNVTFECDGDTVTLSFAGESNVTVTYDLAVAGE